MRRLVVRSVTLIFGGALALAAQSTSLPTFWRYSHPDARLLAGVDVKGLLASQFGTRVASEFRQAGFTAKATADGLNFFNEVERVLISSPGAPAGPSKEQPPAVLALQGKFDLAKIRAFVRQKGAKRTYYQKVELLSPEAGSAADGQNMSLALVSAQTILLGDRPSVKAALDHFSTAASAAASATPLYARAVALSAVHDIWFVSEVSPSDFASQGGGELPGPMAIFADVESFEGGASFQRGLGLELNLNTSASESAEKIATGLQALMALAAMAPPKDGQPNPADLLKKLTVAYDAAQVKLSLAINQAELDRGLDGAKVAILSGMKTTVASAGGQPPTARGETIPPPLEAAIEPPRPLVIKVYNADGGTREIPLKPR